MRLVELRTTRNRFEADVIVARLRDAGVEAVVFGADAGGWAPHFTFCSAHRIMVPEDAAEFATELLDPAPPGALQPPETRPAENTAKPPETQ